MVMVKDNRVLPLLIFHCFQSWVVWRLLHLFKVYIEWNDDYLVENKRNIHYSFVVFFFFVVLVVLAMMVLVVVCFFFHTFTEILVSCCTTDDKLTIQSQKKSYVVYINAPHCLICSLRTLYLKI